MKFVRSRKPAAPPLLSKHRDAGRSNPERNLKDWMASLPLAMTKEMRMEGGLAATRRNPPV
jgi:hypothetical protein